MASILFFQQIRERKWRRGCECSQIKSSKWEEVCGAKKNKLIDKIIRDSSRLLIEVWLIGNFSIIRAA